MGFWVYQFQVNHGKVPYAYFIREGRFVNQHEELAEVRMVKAQQSVLAFGSTRLLKSLVSGLFYIGLAACGGGGGDNGVADSKPVPGLSLIAGNAGGPGSNDGTGSAASFGGPAGITVDVAGNLYVAESVNHTIRKLTLAGVVTTLAGSARTGGSADGIGASARFFGPSGITADALGNLYVADTYNNAIRKITPDGTVSTLAGQAGTYGSADGTGAVARFNNPNDITADAVGNVYVVDGNGTMIRKITPAGAVTTLTGVAELRGSIDGTGATARFSNLSGITSDSAGVLYVTDESIIRKITPDGTVTTLAGAPSVRGSVDGPIAVASFGFLSGISRDASGNLYVADNLHTIRKITPAGLVSTLAGTAGISGATDGIGAAAQFLYGPYRVTVDVSGNLYVTDSTTIRKVTSAGTVTTLAGTVQVTGTIDGIGAVARFMKPAAIAADPAGNLYVADRPSIRKIKPSGVVSTLAGIQICPTIVGPTVDLMPYSDLAGLAADAAGNVYLADPNCHTVTKISPTGEVTTLAGATGCSGSSDGAGSAARFSAPFGITADLDGNLYVTDGGTIRKVTTAGVVTTLAGTPYVFGTADGTGAAARFYASRGITVDKAGNLYVGDLLKGTIRKISPEGVVTTLAGTPGVLGRADGTGANASFIAPAAITVDPVGNVYVADMWASTIRKITPTGVVTTVAGDPLRPGILLGNLPGGLDTPLGVTATGPNTLAVTTGASVLKLVLP